MCAKKVIEPSEILDKGQKSKSSHFSHHSINPWYRCLARVFDYILFVFILVLVGKFTGFLSWINPDKKMSYYSFIVLAGWIPIEALFISLCGRTLGKLLMNIKVQAQSHYTLDYSRAIKRALLVWYRGIGMGFYFVAPFTMLYAYSKLKTGRQMSWDLEMKTVIHQEDIPSWRYVLTVSLCIALISFVFFM